MREAATASQHPLHVIPLPDNRWADRLMVIGSEHRLPPSASGLVVCISYGAAR
jgi:hypothetical protein